MKLRETLKIVISLCLSITPIGSQASSELRLERGDKSEITYYISSNKLTKNQETLLVLIQGSDCNSVYHNKLINDTFSQVIPNADVLTVEKYGIDSGLKWDDNPEREDCPYDYIANDSPQQRVDDYNQVLDYLTGNREYNRIVLLGGSEGAVIANMLTAERNDVVQTVSLNGGGRWFINDVLHSIKVGSLSKESYDESANEFIGFTEHILGSEPFEINVNSHGYKWWRNVLGIDQTMFLKKIVTPVLIIQSGMDQSVSVPLANSQAVELIKYKPNIVYKTYNELDHSLMLPNGVSQVEKVVDDIKLWLDQQQKLSK